MDERGQASTEYLLLTAVSVVLALLAAVAVIATFHYTDQIVQAITSIRRDVVGVLLS